MGFLDSTGLATLVSQIKELVADNKYVHPTATAHDSGIYKITVDGMGHITNATAITKSDLQNIGYESTGTSALPAKVYFAATEDGVAGVAVGDIWIDAGEESADTEGVGTVYFASDYASYDSWAVNDVWISDAE